MLEGDVVEGDVQHGVLVPVLLGRGDGVGLVWSTRTWAEDASGIGRHPGCAHARRREGGAPWREVAHPGLLLLLPRLRLALVVAVAAAVLAASVLAAVVLAASVAVAAATTIANVGWRLLLVAALVAVVWWRRLLAATVVVADDEGGGTLSAR
jgi:hypothetical protein